MTAMKKITLLAAIKQTQPFRHPHEELYLSIIKTASDLSHRADQFFRPHGITQIQYNVLRILRGAGPEGLCRNEISGRMITAAPDMSRLLERMEKQGLISRSRDREDKRQVSSTITKKGEKLLQQLDEPLHRHLEGDLLGLGEKKTAQLLELLEEVRGMIAM